MMKQRSIYKLYVLLLAIGIMISSSSVHAQRRNHTVHPESTADIEGKVLYRHKILNTDNFIHFPAVNVIVRIEAGEVTLEQKVVDVGGNFSFKGLPVTEATLTVYDTNTDKDGNPDPIYETLSVTFPLVKGKNVATLEVEYIRARGEFELDPALSIARNPLVKFRGDTLVYNTSLLEVGEATYAIDLLKQLPGIEIKGRSILLAGQNIQRTYVNGALIFGYDPMNAMEYLSADNVESIESYTEYDPTDRSGSPNRQKQRVLNVKTKEPIFSVADIQSRVGIGFDGAVDDDGDHQMRYITGFDGKFFSEMRQVSASVVLDNLSLATGYLGTIPESLDRYSENATAKLSYQQYWNDRFTGNGISMDYDYKHSWSKDASRTLAEYYELADIPAKEVENTNLLTDRIDRHTVNVVASLYTPRLFDVSWNSSVSVSRNGHDSRRTGYTLVDGFDAMNTDWIQRSRTDNWSLSEAVRINLKRGYLRPSITTSLTIGRDGRDQWEIDTLSSSYLKRFITKAAEDVPVTISSRLSHRVIDVHKGSDSYNANAFYETSYRKNTSIQEAYDLYGTDVPVLNAANTYDYTNKVFNLKGGLTYSIGNRLLSLSGDIALSSDRIVDVGKYTASPNADKTFWSVLPTMVISFKHDGRQLPFVVNYMSMPILPAVEQIRGRLDDSNPLFLRAGNPDISKAMNHTVSVNYVNVTTEQKADAAAFNYYVSVSVITNPIANRTIYFDRPTRLEEYGGYIVPAGASLSTSVNTSPSYSGRLSMSYSDRVYLFRGNVTPTVTIRPELSYSDKPQYFGQELDRTKELRPALEVSFVMTRRKTDVSLSTTTSYDYVWNSTADKVKVLNNRVSLNARQRIGQYLSTSVTYSMSDKTPFIEGVSRWTNHRLGVSLGADLLKRRLQVSLSGHDLLNGGSVYTVTSEPEYVSQVWRNSFGRFIMFSAIYRFNSSNGSKVFFGRTL